MSGVLFADSARRATASLRERASEGLQRRNAPSRNGREKLDGLEAVGERRHELGGGGDAGNERNLALACCFEQVRCGARTQGITGAERLSTLQILRRQNSPNADD